jgi:glutamate synthase (NADPH/NADH) large chain
LAFARRYRDLLSGALGSLGSNLENPENLPNPENLGRSQSLFSCSREEIEIILKPMLADGHEAVGSMGDDAPPAVLSSRNRLFTDFFRQRFAQVTNPPVDPYREASVMSLTTLVGAQGSYVDELAPRRTRIALRSPILTSTQLAQLTATRCLEPHTIAMLFDPHADPHDGADAFVSRLDAIVDEARQAVERGCALIVLSDRGAGAERAPLPSLLVTAAVHHGLIDAGLRLRASIVVEAGDARDAHQTAALFAFGASAVCPWLGYQTIAAIAPDDPTGCRRSIARYRLAPSAAC